MYNPHRAQVSRPILFHGQLDPGKLAKSWTDLTRHWPILLARAASAAAETGVPGDIWLWLPHSQAAVEEAIAHDVTLKDDKQRQVYVETRWQHLRFTETEFAQWYPALGEASSPSTAAGLGIGEPVSMERLRPLCFANGAQSFVRDMLDKPRPLITVQITLFRDKTLISPYWSHLLFDGFGSKYVMEAWQAVLGGQAPRKISLDELRALPIDSPARTRGQHSRAEHPHQPYQSHHLSDEDSSRPAGTARISVSTLKRVVIYLLGILRRLFSVRAFPRNPAPEPPTPPPGFLLLWTAWAKVRIFLTLAMQILVTRRESLFQTRHVFVTNAYLDRLQAQDLAQEHSEACQDDAARGSSSGRVGKSSLLFAWVLRTTFWPYRNSQPNLRVQPITLFNLRGRKRSPATTEPASNGADLHCPSHPFFNAAFILPLPMFTPSELAAGGESRAASATPALTLLGHARHNHASVKSALLDANKVEALVQFVTWIVRPKGTREPGTAADQSALLSRAWSAAARTISDVRDAGATVLGPWPYFGSDQADGTATAQRFLGMSDLRAFRLGQIDFSQAAARSATKDHREDERSEPNGDALPYHLAEQPSKVGRPAAISSYMFPQGYRDRFSVTGETEDGVWLVGSLTRKEWQDPAGWGTWL